MAIHWHDNPQLVKVTWDDAVNLSTWHTKEDIEEFYSRHPEKVENIGYLIGSDETGAVYVAARLGHFNDNEDAWGLIERIPNAMLDKVRPLYTEEELKTKTEALEQTDDPNLSFAYTPVQDAIYELARARALGGWSVEDDVHFAAVNRKLQDMIKEGHK